MRTDPSESDPATVLPDDHPLWSLHERQLGPYRLHLRQARQLPSSGWKGFRLALSLDGATADEPVLAGIHSVGGKGVAPWFDLDFRRVLEIDDGPGRRVDLREKDLEVPLFAALREEIPANGHAMVAYEHVQHRESHQGLKQGVPPVATPLGWALWRAGFDGGFKDWHISEGGHEGPKKLQANVPVDKDHRRRAARQARTACEDLLERLLAGPEREPPESHPDLWPSTRARLDEILQALGEAPENG